MINHYLLAQWKLYFAPLKWRVSKLCHAFWSQVKLWLSTLFCGKSSGFELSRYSGFRPLARQTCTKYIIAFYCCGNWATSMIILLPRLLFADWKWGICSIAWKCYLWARYTISYIILVICNLKIYFSLRPVFQDRHSLIFWPLSCFSAHSPEFHDFANIFSPEAWRLLNLSLALASALVTKLGNSKLI